MVLGAKCSHCTARRVLPVAVCQEYQTIIDMLGSRGHTGLFMIKLKALSSLFGGGSPQPHTGSKPGPDGNLVGFGTHHDPLGALDPPRVAGGERELEVLGIIGIDMTTGFFNKLKQMSREKILLILILVK